MLRPTKLSSLHGLLVRYQEVRKEGDTLWAQVLEVLPNATEQEVVDFLSKTTAPKPVSVPRPFKAPKERRPLKSVDLKKRISKARKAVAQGKLPPLKVRIKKVMGDKDMEVKVVIAELDKKGWLPESNDISTYISFMLSSLKNDFVRIKRGVYKVKPQATLGEQRTQLYQWVWTCLKGQPLTAEKMTSSLDYPKELKAALTSYRKLNLAAKKKALSSFMTSVSV